MKFLKKLVPLLPLLFISNLSQARDVCFKIFWSVSSEGDHLAKQESGTQYFVTINGSQDVGFRIVKNSVAKDKYGKEVRSQSKGCINSDKFKLGRNRISFSYSIGDGSAILEGWEQAILVIYYPDGSSEKLSDKFYSADPNRTKFEVSTTIRLDIEKIDPQAAAEVQSLKSQVSQKSKDYERTKKEFQEDKFKLEKIIEELSKKSFDEMTLEDLQAYQEAQEKLKFLKEGVEAKRNDLESKKGELRDTVEEVREIVTKELSGEGYDFTDEDFFEVPTDFSLIIEVPTGENPFDFWANETINDLSYVFGNDQRILFLEKVALWTAQADSFLDTVNLSSNASDIANLAASIKKVENYVYGVNGSGGILDGDQWFSDNPVPVAIRSDLVSTLNETGDANLIRLASAVKTWKSSDGKLTENQKSLLALSYGMWNLTKFFRSLPRPVKEDFPEVDPSGISRETLYSWALDSYNKTLANHRKLWSEIVDAVEQGIELRVSLSPASPIKAICEIFTQRKWCSGTTDLSLEDSVVNMVEIFPWFGKAVVKIGSFSKSKIIDGVEVFGAHFKKVYQIAVKVYDARKYWARNPSKLRTVVRVFTGGKIELFGGKSGKLPDSVNLDIIAEKGLKVDLLKDKLSFIPDDSIDEIVTFNPFIPREVGGSGILDYLEDAARVTAKGGTITISGTKSNKFAFIKNTLDLDALGLEVVVKNGPLLEKYRNFKFYTIDGKLLDNSKILSSVLRKK